MRNWEILLNNRFGFSPRVLAKGLTQPCQAKSVLAAFNAERTYLLLTTKAKKPNPQPPELLTELHHHTGAVDGIRESNRPSVLFPHLSAISEGIVALGWIVETRPADFVADTLGSAQFFGNRVLKEYKEKYVSGDSIKTKQRFLQNTGIRRIPISFKPIIAFFGP